MFDRTESDAKFQHLFNERTAAQFGDSHEESFVFEVQAEREYVTRLKNQREKVRPSATKIEQLYSKYDVLLRDLKSKEVQLKEKDKTIHSLESKCKTLAAVTQETTLFRQQNQDIRSENVTLQKALAELEESFAHVHGQLRSKEVVTSQKYEQMEAFNDDIMGKLRSMTKKYQEREEEFAQKYKELASRFEEFKTEAKREKEQHLVEEGMLSSTLLQREEELRLLKTENECLRERINELQVYMNELTYDFEEKVEHVQKEKKCQIRILKNEIDSLRENNSAAQRKWQKLKEECQLKELSVSQMALALETREKQSAEAVYLLKQQHNQEKGVLKEQLIQSQNHIGKLERKIADCVRKEQCLSGKIKKYEVCLDAKRNLREVEKEELDRINMLLNLA